jgi:hypothetical protein
MGKIEGGAAEVIARVIVTVKQAFPKCTVEEISTECEYPYLIVSLGRREVEDEDIRKLLDNDLIEHFSFCVEDSELFLKLLVSYNPPVEEEV